MKIEVYCQSQSVRDCSPLNVLFSDAWITLILLGVPPLGSTIRIQWAKIAIFNLYTRKYLANGNRKSHIVDLPSCTHCCRALTFASARLSSCNVHRSFTFRRRKAGLIVCVMHLKSDDKGVSSTLRIRSTKCF